jgi:putative membrane protein insertion efficiency factor
MNRLRHAIWVAGTPVRAALIGAIRLYRLTLSGWLGGQCRFYPTCSHYAEDAIRLRGAGRGTALAAWRILRCNPFGRGGVEHLPAPGTRRAAHAYDGVLHPGGLPPGEGSI